MPPNMMTSPPPPHDDDDQEQDHGAGNENENSNNIVVLGGDAIIVDGPELSNLVSNSNIATVITPAVAAISDVSVSGLLDAMASCMNGFNLIEELLVQPEWVAVFRGITPEEYGNIIERVNIAFDQSRVATLLTPYVNGGVGGNNNNNSNSSSSFTCQYAAAAVRNASTWNRANMTQQLVSLCVDIATEHELIRAELNEWERCVTAQNFEQAIAEISRYADL